jgi:hypothetical protein
MKTARVILCSLFSLLFSSNIMAQSRAITIPGERYVAPIGLPRPMPSKFTVLQGASFKVTGPDSAWADLSNMSPHAFVDTVWNLSNRPETIYFRRTQLIPAAMTSSVCWGATCYPSTVDSTIYSIPVGGTALLSLDLTGLLNDVPDSGQVWLRVGTLGTPSDTVQLYFYGNYLPPDPPIIFQWSNPLVLEQTYQGPGIDSLSNQLENHVTFGVNYTLTYQDSLPAGWTITKFSDTRQPFNPLNYQDTSTTGNTLVTNFSGFADTTYQQLLTFWLNAPVVTKEDSAVIFLGVHPQTSNPADSANYRFVMHVLPLAGVNSSQEARAGVAVTNAWPNPLVGTETLHLEIQTDATGNARAVIYDLNGSEKGVLDLGSLHAGTNEIQASAPNLASGEYIIRVVQDGSSSEVVRINYVK